MTITVSNNADTSRYEVRVNDELAGFADYTLHAEQITFTHTEVFDAFSGQGLAGQLARESLDDVRAQGGRRVVPSCPFYKSWIEKHPDYQDLVGG